MKYIKSCLIVTMLLGVQIGYSQCDANDDGTLDVLDVVIEVNCILTDCWEVCIDIDGNVYETIQIGEQLWMAENLKVTHYNNGDSISYPSNEDFGSYDEGQYGIYDNDYTNADIYGNLYNWAVVDDDRGVCPTGWHVPSHEELTILTDYLGGTSVAGGKMKEAGLDHWNYYSDEITEEATNESGFTGLPGGYRDYGTGAYYGMGSHDYFWSSTEYEENTYAWIRGLKYNTSTVYNDIFRKSFGFSIRCLGD